MDTHSFGKQLQYFFIGLILGQVNEDVLKCKHGIDIIFQGAK